MPIYNNILAGSGQGGADLGETIEQSLRFRNDSGVTPTFLYSTALAGTSLTDYTISVWVKRGNFPDNSARYILTSGDYTTGTGGGTNVNKLSFNNDGATPGFVFAEGGGNTHSSTQPLQRDFSAWYHVVAVQDSTANTQKLYVNGTEIGSASGSGTPGLFNKSGDNAVLIGLYADPDYASIGWNGYMAEFNFLETALSPTDFGRTNDDGVWVPEDLSGLTSAQYGAAGFRLKFDSSAGLGDDSAPIGTGHSSANDFTASGFDTAAISSSNFDNDIDYFDTPTSNYATWNSIGLTSDYGHTSAASYEPAILSDANLKSTGVSAKYSFATPTILVPDDSTETFYFETRINAIVSSDPNIVVRFYDGSNSNQVSINNTGTVSGTGASGTGPSFNSVGDVVGLQLNMSSNTIRYQVNGGTVSSDFTFNDLGLPAALSHNHYNTNVSVNFGQYPFLYQPAGTVALQTNNLPEPTIKNGSDHFQAIVGPGAIGGLLYAEDANDTSARSVTRPIGTLTDPSSSGSNVYTPYSGNGSTYSWIWDAGGEVSSSTFTVDTHGVTYTVRSSLDGITWNTEADALGGDNTITSTNSHRYVRVQGPDWGSAAGSQKMSSSDGVPILNAAQATFPNGLYWIKDRVNTAQMQIVDTVRGVSLASTCPGSTKDTSYSAPSGSSVAWCWQSGEASTNGFNIITFTGNSSSTQAVAHGLPGTPEWIITASRGSSPGGFETFHQGCSSGKSITIDSNRQEATSSRYSGVDATNITYGGDYNTDGQNMIAYAWTSIEGYSKFGTYTGNGSADGPFLYCGFKPALVITKGLNVTGTQWFTYDSTRDSLNPNLDDIRLDAQDPDHGTDKPIDFLSNGFKIRYADSAGYINYSGLNFVFMAFAENPFGGENAPPATAR